MTVDKPPLFLWVQTASVKLFGLSSWSLLGPQAVMGVGSTWFVYDLTRRQFGRCAGFVAGATLGVTPIFVAVSRSNNPDALLILCCAAGVWAVVRGLEEGSWRWLMVAAVAIGMGFETKMFAALLIVPAAFAAWFWIAPRGRPVAMIQLLICSVVIVVISLAWPLVVWLTPAQSRPWISGTNDNNIWSLVFGYNGLGRVAGQQGIVRANHGNDLFAGIPGPFRLLNDNLGTQIGWVLGLTVVVGFTLLIATRLRRYDSRTGWLLVVGGSALTILCTFSFASGIIHPYYVSLLSPFIACLVGAGFSLFTSGQNHEDSGMRRKSLAVEGTAGTQYAGRIAGAVALLAAVVGEVKILSDSALISHFVPILIVGGLGLGITLVTVKKARVQKRAVATSLCLLLIVPAYWSLLTIRNPGDGAFPYGGPSLATLPRQPASVTKSAYSRWSNAIGQVDSSYLKQNALSILGIEPIPIDRIMRRRGESYPKLLPISELIANRHGGGTIAVAGQWTDTSRAIVNGENVAAIGGYSGRESEVSLHWLADMIESKRLRWFVTGNVPRKSHFDHRMGAMRVMGAITRVCKPIETQIGLYDCREQADRLRHLRLTDIPPLAPKSVPM